MCESIDSGDLTIRPMTLDDADTMERLEESIFPEEPWTRALIDEELTAASRVYVLATQDGTPVGYGGITLWEDADIMTLGVVGSHRGAGFGSRILHELLRHASDAQVKRVFLEVRKSNVAAQHMYHKAGFELLGSVRNYFRHPTEDAHTMRLVQPLVPKD